MDMNKYNEWPANHKGDKNPSPKIIALGKRITDVAGHMIGGVTAEDPEYWGLAEIITEEMAEVGLTMKRRVHYTFDQLCEMNKDKVAEKGKEGFQKLLDEMSDFWSMITAIIMTTMAVQHHSQKDATHFRCLYLVLLNFSTWKKSRGMSRAILDWNSTRMLLLSSSV